MYMIPVPLMRHCHFRFFHKIRFSLCLALFLIGLGIFCAAVCKCADSDTWIAQFLSVDQIDSAQNASDNALHKKNSAKDAADHVSHRQDYSDNDSGNGETTEDAAFNDYLTELFRQEAAGNLLNLHYTLEDPSAYGITDYQTTLGSYTADSPEKAAAFAENVLSALQQFDSDKLSPENQLALDILSEHMNLTKKEAIWYCYDEPLKPTTGLQSQIPILLAEYTFRDKQDISDYLELLADIPRLFSQICQYEQEKSEAGRFMPEFTVQSVVQQCRDFTQNIDAHYLVTTFQQKIDALNGLSENDRTAYQKQNRAILEEQVFPAFEQLADTLTTLQNTGINSSGLCHFPDGTAYYEYLVRTSTGSDDSVAILKKRTEDQRKNDLTVISELLEQNPDLETDLEKELNTLPVLSQSPDEMLETLKEAVSADFPTLPECKVTVKYVDEAMEEYLSPAFYLTSPIDHLAENTIYINQDNGYEGIRLFTTLAHEGFPGHLYQNVYFHSQCEQPIRALLGFPGYTEGWATFVELQSYTYSGLSEEGARLCAANQSAILSLYASTDMGIHYEGWTLEDTAAFFSGYGFTDKEVIRDIFELIVAEPANYLKYYIGYLEFLDLQEKMKKQYPDTYTDTAFYQKVLEIGPAPFYILEKYIQDFR